MITVIEVDVCWFYVSFVDLHFLIFTFVFDLARFVHSYKLEIKYLHQNFTPKNQQIGDKLRCFILSFHKAPMLYFFIHCIVYSVVRAVRSISIF